MRRLILAVVVMFTIAGGTIAHPPAPDNILNATGNFWVNHTWEEASSIGCMTGGWGLISGNSAGDFNGYSWDGSAWDTDASGIAGLSTLYSYSAPTIFQIGDTWYLISGKYHYNNDHFSPKYWYWESIISGYHWTGSTWQSDSGITSGISDEELRLHPSTFEMGGIHHLIIGDITGTFDGYHWTGSAWTTNTTIVSGLGDVGANSAPTIFQMSGTWYLISGEISTNFNGYHWTGSAWTTDSGITTGLGDIGAWSAPTVMYLPTYDTDSYNVSVNCIWHNTTDTYYTDTYSPHGYQNTTVYAYNTSVGMSEFT